MVIIFIETIFIEWWFLWCLYELIVIDIINRWSWISDSLFICFSFINIILFY